MGRKGEKAIAEMVADMQRRRLEAQRASSPRPVVVEPVAADQEPTSERLRHAANDVLQADGLIDKAGERAPKTRRFVDSPIERMRRQNRITEGQLLAANWYAERFEESGIGGRTVANYADRGSGAVVSLGHKLLGNEKQYEARRRWRMARAVIPGGQVHFVDSLVLHNSMPHFINGRQRERFADMISRALQPLAEYLGY